MPRKERVGRRGWRLGDRLGVAVQRGIGSGGTFKARGTDWDRQRGLTGIGGSKEQGGTIKRRERERERE